MQVECGTEFVENGTGSTLNELKQAIQVEYDFNSISSEDYSEANCAYIRLSRIAFDPDNDLNMDSQTNLLLNGKRLNGYDYKRFNSEGFRIGNCQSHSVSQ